MGLSAYTSAAYAGVLRRLLPRGRVWPVEPGTVQERFLGALSQAPARLDADAIQLLDATQPGRATALLPEWEATLGLPDPCLGANPTVAQRQAQVAARFAAGGGQSIAFFVELAASLGFQVRIDQFAPTRAGTFRSGDALAGEAWAYAWRVTILSDPSAGSANLFRAGSARAGDPLGSISSGQATLECEFRRLAPAHSVLLFATA